MTRLRARIVLDPRLKQQLTPPNAQRIREIIDRWAKTVEGTARNLATSGPLYQRTGRLARGIHAIVTQQGNSWIVRLDNNVLYWRVHEFGGRIPAHTVPARPGGVLSFIVNGKVVFTKYVRVPEVQMPERPHMRPAIITNLPALERELLELFGGRAQATSTAR